MLAREIHICDRCSRETEEVTVTEIDGTTKELCEECAGAWITLIRGFFEEDE